MYQIKYVGKIPRVEVSSFAKQKGLVHGFSTRRGGVSEFPYQSLNMGLYTKDARGCVLENRDRFVRSFGIQPQEVVSLHFIHSNIVVEAGQKDGGKGFHEASTALADADGMITNVPRRALFVTYADCVPVLFYDPVHHAIGACHAGWRGTVSGICMEVVKAMTNAYGTDVKDLLVAVGPAIDPENFEVGEDVAEAVRAHAETPSRLLKERANGKYLFDIWQTNVDQLTTVGVPRENITVVDLSTFSRDDLFFSHRRRMGGEVGRQAAVIMLESRGHEE